MPDNHVHALILGIDPGLSIKKPMAMALVDFPDRHLLLWCSLWVRQHSLEYRLRDWLTQFEWMINSARSDVPRVPDLIAIEDVRAPGKGGAHMQCLITHLKERAEGHGIRVELVNPSTVKLHATGYGASSTVVVAAFVQRDYKGADKLPDVEGEYDLEMAVAIAGAGYAVLQKEAREALEKEAQNEE